ncbi:MAG: thioesterase family protein [Acidimicrobiales bacterium]|nr:thioesterase family protein [Acidimicrobiales bacterium]
MTELRATHESTVTEDQIDHLGHMNVRYYGVNAQRGTAAMAGELGLDRQHLRLDDLYTRHHREQMLDTALAVRSGLVDVQPNRVRIYHELVDVDSDVLAATFVHGLTPLDDDGAPCDLTDAVVERLRGDLGDIPAHGASRTIDLDADPMFAAPTLEGVRARGLEMRKPRLVTPDECGSDGFVTPDLAPMLTWAGTPVGRGIRGDKLHDGPNGEKMGWAAMETRMLTLRLPKVGDRIESFGALIGMADKTTHRVHWTFDVERGDLLTSFETVSLAFDTIGRRPMSIPQWIRDGEAASLHPDLAPRACA